MKTLLTRATYSNSATPSNLSLCYATVLASLAVRAFSTRKMGPRLDRFGTANVNVGTVNMDEFKKTRKHTISHYQTIPSNPTYVDPMAYLYDSSKPKPTVGSGKVPAQFRSNAKNKTQKKIENELGSIIPDISTKLRRKILDENSPSSSFLGPQKFTIFPRRVTQSVWHYDTRVTESLVTNLTKETRDKQGLYETSQEEEDANDESTDKTSDEYILRKYQKIHQSKLIELAEGRPGVSPDPHAARVLGLIFYSAERIGMEHYNADACRVNESRGLTPVTGLTMEVAEQRAMFWFAHAANLGDYDSASILASAKGQDQLLERISEAVETAIAAAISPNRSGRTKQLSRTMVNKSKHAVGSQNAELDGREKTERDDNSTFDEDADILNDRDNFSDDEFSDFEYENSRLDEDQGKISQYGLEPPAFVEETLENANRLFGTMMRVMMRRASGKESSLSGSTQGKAKSISTKQMSSTSSSPIAEASFARPALDSADPLSVAVWYYELAVRQSRSPSYLSAYINFLVSLDAIFHRALQCQSVKQMVEEVTLELPLDVTTANTSYESIYIAYARFYLQNFIDDIDLSGEACCLLAEFCADPQEKEVWLQLGRENDGMERKERKMLERSAEASEQHIDAHGALSYN